MAFGRNWHWLETYIRIYRLLSRRLFIQKIITKNFAYLYRILYLFIFIIIIWHVLESEEFLTYLRARIAKTACRASFGPTSEC